MASLSVRQRVEVFVRAREDGETIALPAIVVQSAPIGVAAATIRVDVQLPDGGVQRADAPAHLIHMPSRRHTAGRAAVRLGIDNEDEQVAREAEVLAAIPEEEEEEEQAVDAAEDEADASVSVAMAYPSLPPTPSAHTSVPRMRLLLTGVGRRAHGGRARARAGGAQSVRVARARRAVEA